jgi:hypothetical protein
MTIENVADRKEMERRVLESVNNRMTLDQLINQVTDVAEFVYRDNSMVLRPIKRAIEYYAQLRDRKRLETLVLKMMPAV